MIVTNVLLGVIIVMLLALFGKLGDIEKNATEINVNTSIEAKKEIAEMVKSFKDVL